MPMPKPEKDESHDTWMDRCVVDDEMKKKYPDSDDCKMACQMIWDMKKEGMMKDSLVLPAEKRAMAKWSKDDAVKWLKDNDFKSDDYDKMENWHSFRQTDPAKYSSFVNDVPSGKVSDDGIQFILGIWTEDGEKKSEVQSVRFHHGEGEQKSASDEGVERRVFVNFELRTDETGKEKITFYPAVFNSLSEDMWGMRERIQPGCFSTTIKEDDIRALFNHDPNYVLGRNTSGTLTLAEDQKGLRGEIDPPDTSWARDLMVSIRRKDISQGSFAFKTLRDAWDYSREDYVLRDLLEAKLYDVSIVTYPAYPETSIVVRSKITTKRSDDKNIEEQRKTELAQQEQRERDEKLRQESEEAEAFAFDLEFTQFMSQRMTKK